MKPSSRLQVMQLIPGALHRGITSSREYQSSQTPRFAGRTILVRTPAFAGDCPGAWLLDVGSWEASVPRWEPGLFRLTLERKAQNSGF